MPNQNGVRSLWDLALLFFRTHVLKNSEIEHKVITGLLYMIEKERQGDWIDRSMVKELIRMLVALQVCIIYCSIHSCRCMKKVLKKYS